MNTASNESIRNLPDAGLESCGRQMALDEYESAVGTHWDIWLRVAPGEWTLARPAAEAESRTNRAERLTFNPMVMDQLESVYREKTVEVAQVRPGEYLVAAPLLGDTALVEAVITTQAEEGAHEQIVRLTRLTAQLQRLRLRADELQSENAFFAQQVSDDFEEMTFLRTMSEDLAVDDDSLSIGQVVERSFAMLHGILGAEVLCFIEHQPGTKPRCTIRRGVTRHQRQATQKTCDALAEQFAPLACEGPLVRNYLQNLKVGLENSGAHQLLVVPVATGAKHFGWFMAVNRGSGYSQHGKAPLLCSSLSEFGTWEASLMSTAASVIASHASNLELLREKGQLLVNVVRSLVSAVEAKDAYTCGHSERVALYTRRIAEHLSYDEEAAERLYLTGLLHDVGKIGVSDATLNKPGKLSSEEFSEIQEHPDHGWAILCELMQLDYVLPGVLHHHERFDGAGYPDGLAGDRIPLDARIMAVADSYDAMTSDRAYRAGLPHEKAVSILREGAGSQWDPEVVAAFFTVVEDIVEIRNHYQPHQRPVRKGSAL